MGGVRAIYVFLRSNITGYYIEYPWGPAFYHKGGVRIPCRGSFESVAQVDDATGAVYFLDTLSVTPDPGRQGNDPMANLLGQFASIGPDDLVIFVETWNNESFVMGYGFTDPEGEDLTEFPVFFGGGQYASGTEKTDANSHSFIFTSVHPQPAANGGWEEKDNIENVSTD